MASFFTSLVSHPSSVASSIASRPSSSSSIHAWSAATTPEPIEISPSIIGDPSDGQYVMVIGGLGFIGSHTSLDLLKAGYNVMVVDDLSNSFMSILRRIRYIASQHCKANGRQMPHLEFHKMDYRSRSMRLLLEMYSDFSVSPEDETQVSWKSRISGVIHFAAFKSVSESIKKPISYYQNNISGLISLLELLDEHNIRNFVFSSSATVYGAKANWGRRLREHDLVHFPESWTDEEGQRHDEEPLVTGLTSPYGRSKYFGEAILADIAKSDPRWRIRALRYFNPVGCESTGALGENPRQVPTNLFPVIGQVMTGERDALPVFGTDWDTRDGTAIRDYVHVMDIAHGHVLAVSNLVRDSAKNKWSDEPFRAYNLGSGDGTTVLEAVKSMEAASKKKIKVDLVGRRDGDVGLCIASNNRAHQELGWLPQETINQCATDLWNCLESRLPANRVV